MEIYTTTNYEMFGRIAGNRAINSNSVKKLVSSIKDYGLINPITVNENLEIIDGQHRLEACKYLGIPVKYMMTEKNCDSRVVQSINSTQHSWTLLDAIKSYAETGNTTYQWVLLQYKYHGWMKFTTLARIIGIKNKEPSESFFLNLEERSVIERKLEYLDRYEKIFDKMGGHQQQNVSAIGYLYDYDEVDNERLYKVVLKATVDWVQCATTEAVLKQIEEFYNSGLRRKIPIVIDYKNYCKSPGTKNLKQYAH
jgi:hypothetical protein